MAGGTPATTKRIAALSMVFIRWALTAIMVHGYRGVKAFWDGGCFMFPKLYDALAMSRDASYRTIPGSV